MNNVTFGNARVQYYETVASGSGAGDGFDGADAVQTHMTNSRLTDPEILEWRHPVRVDSFAVREDDGGRGRWRGGHGVERRIRFLEPMTVALLTGHRRIPRTGWRAANRAPSARTSWNARTAPWSTSAAPPPRRWAPTTSWSSAPPAAVATARRPRRSDGPRAPPSGRPPHTPGRARPTGVNRRPGQRTGANRTGVPGTACAAAPRSASRTTPTTG